ncbi:ABC transporter substrate-binding protein [Spirillospora sp. CA-294931]|uniref:ABC transporter substrate-binding protein n=1 Tax=Spirillospora sp. CA-294931 TaxID=3240042 RepID=UPI003D89F597
MMIASSCGGSDGKKSSGPNGLEKSEIKVGVIPIADAVAVPLAQAKGYFKAEGLTVKIEKIQGGAIATQSLMAGSLDVTQSNYVSTLLARSKKQGIKVVADAASARPGLFKLMVRKDSPVRSPGDLKGKTIAVNTKRNVGELAVRSTLNIHGIKGDELKFVEYAFPEMGPALEKKQVDAAWVTEPFISTGESKQGLRAVADTMAGPTAELPIAGWQVTEKFSKENPKTVAAFRRAVVKAQQLASQDRSAVQDTLPSYTTITDKNLIKVITMPGYPTSLSNRRIQRVADLMKQFEYLPSGMDTNALVKATLEGATD